MNYDELYSLALADYKRKKKLATDRANLITELETANQKYIDLLESQRLLSSLSEENTVKTLDYITTTINKVLADIFKGQTSKIYLEKVLHNNRYAHINVQLESDKGVCRDLDLQTGSGVKEVVSFLFTICLISVRGGRKLIITDEILSGLHRDAKIVISDIIRIFAKNGFQFIMVEYNLDTYTDERGSTHSVGKIYNVENTDNLATLVEVDDGEYDGRRYIVNS